MNDRKYSIQIYLKLINKEMTKLLQSRVDDFDLTKSQMDIIRILGQSETPLCQKDIQDALHVTNPTVTGLLNRMEKKGFIKRVPDAKDHRVNVIALTHKAEKVNQMIVEYFKKLDRTIQRGLSEKQMEDLPSILNTILTNLEGEN